MSKNAFKPTQRAKLDKKLDNWLSRTAQPRKPNNAYQQALHQLYSTGDPQNDTNCNR